MSAAYPDNSNGLLMLLPAVAALMRATALRAAHKWRGVRRVRAEPLISARRASFEPLSQKYQPACKPGSVGHHSLAQVIRDGHSSGTMFAHGLEQPTRTASLTSPCGVITRKRTYRVAVPIRFCSRCGLPCRFRCRIRGALLPHLFTLTAPKPRRAKAGGSFSVALSLGSPPPDVIRHRMSMEPGLSSPAAFRP